MSPLHFWIKDIIIKLAFALFHVCPGSPSPLSSQGHISELFISMLAKMGKRKMLNLESCEILTSLIHSFHVNDFFSSSDSQPWALWSV